MLPVINGNGDARESKRYKSICELPPPGMRKRTLETSHDVYVQYIIRYVQYGLRGGRRARASRYALGLASDKKLSTFS